MRKTDQVQRRNFTILLFTLFVITLLSGLDPYDRATWLMEVFPIFVALPILFVSRKTFPLTRLLYALIGIHALILILGGIYTYARVPLGFWIQDIFSLDRNPYDKIGHFAQGFVPALIAREIFIRKAYVHGRKMTAFLSVCVVMAISAWYELIEWAAALCLGQGADEFLGTQGYEWDTQSDMFFALIGSLVALATLSHLHDHYINRLKQKGL